MKINTTPLSNKRKITKIKLTLDKEEIKYNLSDSEDVYFINTTKKSKIDNLSDEEDLFFIGCKPGNLDFNNQKLIIL